MDRIVLDQKVDIGKEVVIKGPPMEALCFQGGRVGSLVTLTDSEGSDFRGRVTRLSGTEGSIFIFDAFPSPTESSLEINLLQALPEKERMELIIQKTTELGVSTILPFQSERSISLKEREAKQKKTHRWQYVAVKAVQQSRRAKMPHVGECRPFQEVLGDCSEDGLKILLWEKGKRLAWQQRKAESFTVSPLHSGNADLGYRRSASYGGPDGISLGTAITISGAAASPNMGYHSSPTVGFIMTLLNARLGSWLGNPGEAGKNTWKLPGPRSATSSLVREAFGLTTNTSSYVYLSDGGHFENLGLYEMIRRGCRCIVVLDSGADPHYTYEDLGNALRKIRIDMNISIDFEDALLEPLRKKTRRCAIGTIRYSKPDPSRQDGCLIYVKPVMVGNESPDITTYKATNPEFPHESTADQWFSESQTESYRLLGRETIREICEGWEGGADLEAFGKHVAERYLGPIRKA